MTHQIMPSNPDDGGHLSSQRIRHKLVARIGR